MTAVVAYIGNFLPPHSTENDVSKALDACGATVWKLQEDDPRVWENLPALVDGADLVLWTRTWFMEQNVQRAALDAVRATRMPVVGFHLDRWWGLKREDQIRTEPYFTHTDLSVTADGGHDEAWRSVGVRHVWMPPAVLGSSVGLVEPDPLTYPNKAVFVGSWRTYHEEWPWRFQMVDALRKRYGKSPDLGLYPQGRGPIRGQALATLYATAQVVIGDSCLAGGIERYWSDRVPETLGRGGILIHPKVEGLPTDGLDGALWLYQRNDIGAMFDALDGALAMSDADRARARQAGIKWVRDGQTYEHRMMDLLRLVLEDFTPTRRLWTAGGAAMFQPRAESSDDTVLDEMWQENVYRLDPDMVRGGNVVDLGANVGSVSIWAAVNGARNVWAVEPEPGNLGRLYDNLNLNGLGADPLPIDFSDQVTVFPWAILGQPEVETDGPVSYVSMSGEGGDAKVGDGEVKVEARPFWYLMDLATGGGDDPVDLLKIDIEGSEWEILTEPANVALIGDQVRRMVIEFHGPAMGCERGARSFDTAVGLLAEYGKVEVLGRPSVGGTIWWEAYR